MTNPLLKFMSPPKFGDEEQTRKAELLHYGSIIIFVFTLVLFGINVVFGSQAAKDSNWLLALIALLQFLIQWMIRVGHVNTASLILLTVGWGAITAINWTVDGLHDEAVYGYVLVLVASGYLLGWRIAIFYTFASITAIWWLAYLEAEGKILPDVDKPYLIAIDMTVIFILISFVVFFLINTLSKAIENSERELSERELIEAEREELINKLSKEVTERVRIQVELEQLARTDALTGLFNRRYFFEIAEREFVKSTRYNRPLSVVIFDLDEFKDVNDTYGHPAGDQALIHFSKLLDKETREPDISARYGGEEFIVLLPETDCNSAKVFAERFRQKVENSPVQYGDDLISLTVSAGVSGTIADKRVETLGDLVLHIDQALYKAKRLGRNRVVNYIEENIDGDPMPYTIKYLEDKGIIEIISYGTLTYEDWERQGREAVELGIKKDTNLLLADNSRLASTLEVAEIFSFPDLWERIGTPRTNRLAVLVSDDVSLHLDFKYFEIVCTQSGWNIKLFSNKEAAFDWLLAEKQMAL